jgi:hypothetical protein
MAKYTPSIVDVSGFNKALNEQVFRNAQLNLRREQLLDNDITQFQRSYTGKLGPNDLNKFNDYFSEWTNLSKLEQRARRSGERPEVLSRISMASQMAKKKMDDFTGRSIAYNQLRTNLGKLPKNSIGDTEQYQTNMNALATLDSDELDARYGGVDKVPQVYKFNMANFNPVKFNSAISSSLKFIPKPAEKYIPSMKDGKRFTQTRELSANDAVGNIISAKLDVPQKQLNITADPIANRQAVEQASYDNTANKDFLKFFREDIINSANNQQDPVRADASSKLLNYAMTNYGKSSIENISGEDLYAAKITMDGDLGVVYEDDYDALGDIYDVFRQRAGVTKDRLSIASMQQGLKNAKKESSLTKINQLVSLYQKTSSMGLYDDKIIDILNNSAKDAGINFTFTKQLLKEAAENRVNISNKIIEAITNKE